MKQSNECFLPRRFFVSSFAINVLFVFAVQSRLNDVSFLFTREIVCCFILAPSWIFNKSLAAFEKKNVQDGRQLLEHQKTKQSHLRIIASVFAIQAKRRKTTPILTFYTTTPRRTEERCVDLSSDLAAPCPLCVMCWVPADCVRRTPPSIFIRDLLFARADHNKALGPTESANREGWPLPRVLREIRL